MSRERIVIAMSGGVDSSLAAALLVETGAEVIGVTMRLVADGSRCCSLDDADDARRVADSLGIRFYVADYADAFRREVMEPFADAYLAGRTPIPCITCNRRFKFRHLMERAHALGASAVATGHYARIATGADGRPRLLRARDVTKDQSYFLFDLDADQLARIRFPLGELTKEEVRARARALGLSTADKPESQEICFVPDGNVGDAVARLRPGHAPGEGDVVDAAQQVVGRHDGIHRFTVGQRRGLGVAAGERVYVTGIDVARNRVRIGDADALLARAAELDDVSWATGMPPPTPQQVVVRIRHRHDGAAAVVEATAGGGAVARFDHAVRAISPGQAAVFYDGEVIVGGGWIRGALP